MPSAMQWDCADIFCCTCLAKGQPGLTLVYSDSCSGPTAYMCDLHSDVDAGPPSVFPTCSRLFSFLSVRMRHCKKLVC